MADDHRKAGTDTKKRRYRYLFRRDSKQPKQVAPSNEGQAMPYQFPDIDKMRPQEVEQEIKMRVKSLQRRGLLPCTDPASLTVPPAVVAAQSKQKFLFPRR